MKIKFKGTTEDGRIVYGGFSVHATGKIVQTKNDLAITGKVVKFEEHIEMIKLTPQLQINKELK